MAIYQIPMKEKKENIFSKMNLTTKIIVVNVFCFILFSLLVSLGVFSWDYIALNPANVLDGNYLWTFITSMFMHGGIFHLFVNMLSLFFVGNLIEKILGKKRYISFYLISGIFSGVFFVLAALLGFEALNVFAVGASGALFGLVGLLVLLTPNLPVYVMFIPIPIKMKYAAPGMLVILWIISVTGNIPIGNVAHLGGLVIGLIYGLYLRRMFPNKIRAISAHFS